MWSKQRGVRGPAGVSLDAGLPGVVGMYVAGHGGLAALFWASEATGEGGQAETGDRMG